MRVGVDLDGVLADMESELIRQAERLFGKSVARSLEARPDEPPVDPPAAAAAGSPENAATPDPADEVPVVQRLRMTRRQQTRLWRHVEGIENFWESLEEHEPGAVARLAEIAAQRQWEIIFLTKRPTTAGATAQVQSQRWLVSKGFPLPSVYVVQKSRGLIGAALGLDALIDDRPENCLDIVMDSKARAVLVWRYEESQLPAATRRLGIEVQTSVNGAFDSLLLADAPVTKTIVNRVKKMLGMKAAPLGRVPQD
jgi:hypothetical protein